MFHEYLTAKGTGDVFVATDAATFLFPVPSRRDKSRPASVYGKPRVMSGVAA